MSPDFLVGKYSREHTWSFDGGATMRASPSPNVVPVPYSNPAHVDPEEAFVALIASCHMLTYLYLASRQGFQLDSYHDEAVGVMSKNERGVSWVSVVTLHPQIAYSGAKLPTPAEEERLHHMAREQCFIANSIKTEVVVMGTKHES
jgi:organic hydroperoxide reductase OsmC/OhrA